MTGLLTATSRSGQRLIASGLVTAAVLAGCGAHRGHDDRRFRNGRRVFITAGCGRCHTLAAAHTRGGIGPDLDTSERLTFAQIRQQLNLGVAGMPSFRGRLSARDEDAVAQLVFEAAHGRR